MLGSNHFIFGKYLALIVLCCVCQVKSATFYETVKKAAAPAKIAEVQAAAAAAAPLQIVQTVKPASASGLGVLFDVQSRNALANQIGRAVQGLTSRINTGAAANLTSGLFAPASSLFPRTRLTFGQNEEEELEEEEEFVWGAATNPSLGLTADEGLYVLTYPFKPLGRVTEGLYRPRAGLTLSGNDMLFVPA